MNLKYEPALVVAAVRSVLYAFMAFGFNVSAEQVAAIAVALESLGVLYVRSQTVTTAYLEDAVVGTTVKEVVDEKNAAQA